jgi:hypothetical protein
MHIAGMPAGVIAAAAGSIVGEFLQNLVGIADTESWPIRAYFR